MVPLLILLPWSSVPLPVLDSAASRSGPCDMLGVNRGADMNRPPHAVAQVKFCVFQREPNALTSSCPRVGPHVGCYATGALQPLRPRPNPRRRQILPGVPMAPRRDLRRPGLRVLLAGRHRHAMPRVRGQLWSSKVRYCLGDWCGGPVEPVDGSWHVEWRLLNSANPEQLHTEMPVRVFPGIHTIFL